MTRKESLTPDDSTPPWTADDVRRLVEFARSRVRDLGLGPEDVVAEALAIALSSPAPGGKAPGPWLRGIVRNVIRNTERGDRRRRDRERSSAPREVDDDVDDPQRIAASNEEAARVRAALDRLAAPARRILETRYFEGETPLAIARRLGVPAATIRSRILRSIGALKLAIDDTAKPRPSRGILLLFARIVAVAACALGASRLAGVGGTDPAAPDRARRPRSEFAKMSISDAPEAQQGFPSAEELRSLPRRSPFPPPASKTKPSDAASEQLARNDAPSTKGEK